MRGLLGTLLIPILVATGCSVSSTPGPPTSPSATPAPSVSSGPIGHATGATDLVLRADLGGGLLPPALGLGEMPEVSIYGDGRVVRLMFAGRGPADPLLPRLGAARVTPDGMQRILALAADAGLLGPDRHYELPAVFDLWTVWFTTTVEGTTHRVSAYGLGFSEEERLAPHADMDVRRRLDALFDRLQDLWSWLPPDAIESEVAFVPRQIRIFVSRLPDRSPAGGATPATATAGADRDVREWPFIVPPASFGAPVGQYPEGWSCAVLGPEDLVAAGLDTATWETRWRFADALYQLVTRPLLPDESACPTG